MNTALAIRRYQHESCIVIYSSFSMTQLKSGELRFGMPAQSVRFTVSLCNAIEAHFLADVNYFQHAIGYWMVSMGELNNLCLYIPTMQTVWHDLHPTCSYVKPGRREMNEWKEGSCMIWKENCAAYRTDYLIGRSVANG